MARTVYTLQNLSGQFVVGFGDVVELTNDETEAFEFRTQAEADEFSCLLFHKGFDDYDVVKSVYPYRRDWLLMSAE